MKEKNNPDIISEPNKTAGKDRRSSRHPVGILGFTLICLAVATVLSVIGILFAREIFALNERGRNGGAVRITAENDFGVSEAAVILKKNNLIGSETLFKLYSTVRGKADRIFSAGEYTLSPSAGYDGLIHRLAGGGAHKRKQISVTVPEGSTVKDIIRIVCREKQICSEEDFTKTVQSGNFDKYSFVKELADNPRAEERLYRLEGYLYPDTYYFYSDSSAYTVIDRMLDNFSRHFDEKYRAACKEQGLTVDEALTLASMIMKEAKHLSDYPKVSSVFKNRSLSRSFNGRYQSDATLTYALGRPMEGGDKDNLSPYNTYKYTGLPPSPICNPDMNAVSYALCPDKTSYYYFVSDKNGEMLYATTYDQHRKNVRQVRPAAE